MTELERQLTQLGAEFEYPPTPPLTEAVARRLKGEGESPSRRARHLRRPLPVRAIALSIALVLLLAGAAVAAVPAARNAVLDLVGLRGVAVERVRTLPALPARPGLKIGAPTTLRAARDSVAFRPLLPAELGRPDGVYLRRPPLGGELSLTYPPQAGLPRSRFTGVGLLISEIRGDLVPFFFGKLVARGTKVRSLRVAGHRAIWLSGSSHEFVYMDSRRHVRPETGRLAGNVLLIQHGKVLVRIEGKVNLATARAIGRSLR